MAGRRRDDARGKDDAEELLGLEAVVSKLRADVPVRREWREDVLGEVHELASRGPQTAGSKRWTISPPTAIAAALAFTAFGAAAAAGVYALRDSGGRVASSRVQPEGNVISLSKVDTCPVQSSG